MTNKLARIFHDPFPSLIPSDMIDNMFKDFFRGTDVFDSAFNLAFEKGFPKGDAFVEDGKLNLELMLAGYKKDQLSVLVEDGKIIISAIKGQDEKEGARCRKRGAFKQVYSDLAQQWDLEKAEVTYEDGILRIIIPSLVQEAVVTKKLEIR